MIPSDIFQMRGFSVEPETTDPLLHQCQGHTAQILPTTEKSKKTAVGVLLLCMLREKPLHALFQVDPSLCKRMDLNKTVVWCFELPPLFLHKPIFHTAGCEIICGPPRNRGPMQKSINS